MKTKLSIIKDVLGNNYLAVKVDPTTIKVFLEELAAYIDDTEVYDTLVSNQQKRDNQYYHITVMSVMEWNKCMEVYGLSLFTDKVNNVIENYPVNIKFLGIGEAIKEHNKAYFVVVDSTDLQDVRKSFGLESKDLHVTIGFDRKDVFGVPKNKVLPKQSLLERYVKKHNKTGDYTFIYDAENFDKELITDPTKIQFISLEGNVLTVRINNTKIQLSMIEKSKGESVLWVVTKSNI